MAVKLSDEHEVKPLEKKKYICDGGSILIGTRESNCCFPNGYGDGEHTVYVINSREESKKLGLYERKNWKWLGTVGGDCFNVYYYDCLKGNDLENPGDILFTLSGRYGVFHCNGSIALEKWLD